MSVNTEMPKIVFTISATLAACVVVLGVAKMMIYIPSVQMVKKHSLECPNGSILSTSTSTGLFAPEFSVTCTIVVKK